jgi:hypothetical protein
MFTENKMFNLFFGFKSLGKIAGDFYFQTYVPANIAGYYYAENDYFHVASKRPFTTNTLSMSASSYGNFALVYLLSHMKLEAGVDYGFYYSMLTMRDLKLDKDITYRENYSGAIQTATAGSKADVEISRIELFWGFYAHASVYF